MGIQRAILVGLIALGISVSRGDRQKEDWIFQLVDRVENASLDTHLEYLLVNTSHLDPEDTTRLSPYFREKSVSQRIFDLFRPVSGMNTVLRFRAAFWVDPDPFIGRHEKKVLHESLVLEVDADGVIVNGYTYTEEWAEPSEVGDLYKVGAVGLTLVPNLEIAQLSFVPVLEVLSAGRTYPKNGVIDLTEWDMTWANRVAREP